MNNKEYTSADHTFSVCAYKESPYLEECLLSLIKQTLKSKIIICTSTPNDSIRSLAEKYKLDLHVNDTKSGIAVDWNYAYSMSKTKLVTICHQDDIYHNNYLEQILLYAHKAYKPLIVFTNYSEIRGDLIVKNNINLIIKRILVLPIRFFKSSFLAKRLILSFGDPICCPSVTFIKMNLPKILFNEGFRSDLDWDTWERLSKIRGAFTYCPKKVISHRIHEDSETSNVLNENIRIQEDYIMFKRFWAIPIAKILTKLYSSSEVNNKLE